MFDSRGLPPYPPARNAWSYPPPPVDARWKWVAIGVSVVAAVIATGLVTVAVLVGADDYRGVIDDGDLTALIAEECQIMTTTVESMPVNGPPRRQARIIADQDEAVTTMVRRIRSQADDAIRLDQPAEAWLRDWEQLVAAREAYAGGILAGDEPDLRIPRDDDGDEIYLRMDDVWLNDPAACVVPAALLFPYPDTRSDV